MILKKASPYSMSLRAGAQGMGSLPLALGLRPQDNFFPPAQ